MRGRRKNDNRIKEDIWRVDIFCITAYTNLRCVGCSCLVLRQRFGRFFDHLFSIVEMDLSYLRDLPCYLRADNKVTFNGSYL